MWQLLMAMLKTIGQTAAKGAMAGAKLAAKGVKAVGKGTLDTVTQKGLREEGLAGLVKGQNPELNSLLNAFGGGKKGVTSTTPASETPSTGTLMNTRGSFSGLDQLQGGTPQPIQTPQTLPSIPQNIPIGGMTLQNGIPTGNVGISGNPYAIPSQYMNMGMPRTLQPTTPQTQPTSGGSFLGGLKEGILGMPQTGKSTPYYAGKLLPDILRSRLGVATAGEEAKSGKLMEAYGLKEYTPEFKNDLQYSLKRLPSLNEEQKVTLYQQMAAEYPDKTNELKRIFFPQSQGVDMEAMKTFFAQ